MGDAEYILHAWRNMLYYDGKGEETHYWTEASSSCSETLDWEGTYKAKVLVVGQTSCR